MTLERFLVVDGRSLKAFRVLLGASLLGELVSRAATLKALYTDAGAFPRWAAQPEGMPAWVLGLFPHFYAAGAGGAWILWVLATSAATMLVLRVRPRAAALLSLWLHASLLLRNPLTCQGSDLILCWLLAWSALLPEHPPVEARSAASLALKLQSAWVFLASALQKLGDPAWRSGRALGLILSQEQLLGPLASWLRVLPGWTLTALTVAVLLLEAAGPALLFAEEPWRGAALAAFLAFALATGLVLDLGPFPLADLALLAPFLPAAFWDRLGVGPASGPQSRGAPRAAVVALGVVALASALLSPSSSYVGRLQRWGMFTSPAAAASWWEMETGLNPVRRVYAPSLAPISGETPPRGAMHPGLRWMLFEQGMLRERAWPKAAQAYAEYLCRRWVAEGGPSGRLRLIHAQLGYGKVLRETAAEIPCGVGPSENRTSVP